MAATLTDGIKQLSQSLGKRVPRAQELKLWLMVAVTQLQ